MCVYVCEEGEGGEREGGKQYSAIKKGGLLKYMSGTSSLKLTEHGLTQKLSCSNVLSVEMGQFFFPCKTNSINYGIVLPPNRHHQTTDKPQTPSTNLILHNSLVLGLR